MCPPNCERERLLTPPLVPPARTTDPSASKREHRTKPRPKCLALKVVVVVVPRQLRARIPKDDIDDPQHPAESKTSMSFPFLKSSPSKRVVVVSVVSVANNKGALSSGDDDDDDDAPVVPVVVRIVSSFVRVVSVFVAGRK